MEESLTFLMLPVDRASTGVGRFGILPPETAGVKSWLEDEAEIPPMRGGDFWLELFGR